MPHERSGGLPTDEGWEAVHAGIDHVTNLVRFNKQAIHHAWWAFYHT